MNELLHFEVNEQLILTRRGGKNKVDPFKPYAYLVEKEYIASGKVEDTAVIFLTNRECPFRCLMCDLWKNTTNDIVPVGAIPKQIEWALNHLPPVKHLKLYNSGSFFDKKAIPEQDYESIAMLVKDFETLVVENHPRLTNENCLTFRDMIKPKLQIAMGLETVHPLVLKKLNKQMKLSDFEKAVRFLNQNSISSRAFILLRPPFLSEQEGIFWAEKSLDFAYNRGVECCIIIPVRAGNGALDYLVEKKLFSPPRIQSLENVMEYGLHLNAGRIFSDLWDIEQLSDCTLCFDQRKKRLEEMNLNQKIAEEIKCTCKN